jgi:hypothetical protein
MNQTMDCGEARISLGVYVLGAIDPAERAMVDAHLTTCQECRDELAGLAGLPALLARVSTDEALQLGDDFPLEALVPEAPASSFGAGAHEPPAELLGTVLDLTAARRRRRAWRGGMLAAAAAAVIAVGSFAGSHYLTAKPAAPVASGDNANFGSGGPWETVDTISKPGQSAWVRYRQMGWGLQIDTRVIGIPVGTTCDLYVVTKDGQRVQAANWITDTNEGNVWYSGSSAVMESNVAGFIVTTGGKTPPVVIQAS